MPSNAALTISRSTLRKGGGPFGYQPNSVDEWMNRAPGGQAYGYFGPNSQLLNKDITGAGNTMVGSDFFTNTYGAKVWDSLNSQTRLFNILRKVAFGNTTGWRVRSGRNTSTQPVSETGALPTIQKATLQEVYIQPVFIVSSMGVSALAQFLGTLEGGIGDALAVEQEATMIDHVKAINQQLFASSTQRIVSGAGSGSSTTVIQPSWMSVGDTFIDSGATSTILTVDHFDGSGNPVFTGGSTTTNHILIAQSRAGVTSLDDAVNVDALNINGTSLGGSIGPGYGSLTIANRTSGSWDASTVYTQGSGVLRPLGTGLLDRGIDAVRRNGGEPDLIMTGIEQVTRIGAILQANQHFVGEGTFQVKLGGEGTLMGYPTGFQVSTYKNIPVFHDFDCPTSYQLAANGNAQRGSNVYILDSRYIEIPVLFTTQYLESRDYLQNNMLGIKAIFLTAIQLRVRDFVKQAKIIDLTDGINAN